MQPSTVIANSCVALSISTHTLDLILHTLTQHSSKLVCYLPLLQASVTDLFFLVSNVNNKKMTWSLIPKPLTVIKNSQLLKRAQTEALPLL